MKNNWLLVGMLALGSISFAQEKEIFVAPQVQEKVNPENNPNFIYEDTDDLAHYKGGKAAMMTFLSQNMNYPERAIKDSIQGKCFVRFVVKSDGTISDVRVTREVPNCPECDAEVIRVVKAMPRWVPGRVGGKPVNSYFDLPVNFTMQ